MLGLAILEQLPTPAFPAAAHGQHMDGRCCLPTPANTLYPATCLRTAWFRSLLPNPGRLLPFRKKNATRSALLLYAFCPLDSRLNTIVPQYQDGRYHHLPATPFNLPPCTYLQTTTELALPADIMWIIAGRHTDIEGFVRGRSWRWLVFPLRWTYMPHCRSPLPSVTWRQENLLPPPPGPVDSYCCQTLHVCVAVDYYYIYYGPTFPTYHPWCACEHTEKFLLP